jgi:gluconolactonase
VTRGIGIAFVLVVVGCGGSGGNGASGGTGGKGGSGPAGAGAEGTAGSGSSGAPGAAGTGGASGLGGSSGTGGAAGATAGASGAGPTAGSGGSGPAGAGGAGTGGSSGGVWRCPTGTFAAPALTGLTPQRLANVPPDTTFAPGFSVIEGPVWVAGTLFTTQFGSASRPPPGRLLAVTPGTGAVVANPDLGANGLALDPQGNLIAAVHKDGSIRRLSPSSPTTSTVVAAGYMGKRFNAPNDVTVRSDGTVYFSDPDAYQAPMPAPQTRPRVYRVSPAGEVSVVDETIGQPNGVTLSLDEKTLFVDGDAGLFSFAVMPDGSTGPKTPFGNSSAYTGSDGMVMDCAGDLYVVHNAQIAVLGPTGTELGHITVTGAQAASNVAFGGADHKTLFITTLDSSPGVFQVAMPLPGMPF